MSDVIYNPDNLIAGSHFPCTTEVVTIKQGEVLKRGAVLGKDSDGKYLLSKTDATDGSEKPKRILMSDTDATDEDTNAVVYKSGVFNANRLILGADHTTESIKDDMWVQGIEVRTDSVKVEEVI